MLIISAFVASELARVCARSVQGKELSHGALVVDPEGFKAATGITLLKQAPSGGIEASGRQLADLGAMTQEERDVVLRVHNELRNSIVYPCSPGDMETLVYDRDLEIAAQTYADHCEFNHDPLNGPNDWGENIAMVGGMVPPDQMARSLAYMTELWFSEKKNAYWTKDGVPHSRVYSDPEAYCVAPNPKQGGQCEIGHFTQVAWASSNRIGCGWRNCEHARMLMGSPAFFFICKYSPAGNIQGSPPFVFGAKGAACERINPEYEALCAPGSEVVRCMDTATELDAAPEGPIIPDGCKNLGGNQHEWCRIWEHMWAAPGRCPVTCSLCQQPVELGMDYCSFPPKASMVRPTQEMLKAYEQYEVMSVHYDQTLEEHHELDFALIVLGSLVLCGLVGYCMHAGQCRLSNLSNDYQTPE